MSILVCGSVAFDTVMEVNEKLQFQHADDKPAALDAYFLIPDMRRGFAGCAGNIAYNLKLLGREPLPMATVGNDFQTYAAWLKQCGIRCDYIKAIEHNYTAQSFVTKDMGDNKITAYHSGAMSFAHTNSLNQYKPDSTLAVIAPDGREGMLSHARELHQRNIPFLFYPSTALFEFEPPELIEFIELAHWMMVTEKQLNHLKQQLGLNTEQVVTYFNTLIINQQQNGCLIYADNICHQIPAACFSKKSDFSGCDDAFCAGVLYSLSHDIDWETSGRIASLMWGIVAEYHGAQTHHFNLEQFKQLFTKVFGYRLI